ALTAGALLPPPSSPPDFAAGPAMLQRTFLGRFSLPILNFSVLLPTRPLGGVSLSIASVMSPAKVHFALVSAILMSLALVFSTIASLIAVPSWTWYFTAIPGGRWVLTSGP